MSSDTVDAKENDLNGSQDVKDSSNKQAPISLWEYEHTNGKWVRYTDELAEKLNQITEDFLETEIDEAKIRLDVVAMKQLNLETGFKRNVRCVVQKDTYSAFACWEIKRGRRYEPLARKYCLALEAEMVTTLDIDDKNWEVDYDKMQLTADGTVLKIRRTISAADSSFSAAPVLPARRTRALLKRNLNVDAMTSSQDDKEEEEEQEEVKPKKSTKQISASTSSTVTVAKSIKRTVVLKGRAPVDPECAQKVQTAHVLEEGDLVWDAMLNQTNIGNNNNKFYLMQLLQDDNAPNYSVWFRWGRVGYSGQTSLQTFGTNLEAAKKCFTKKFTDKTANDWAFKDDFESRSGKYTLIHMDYSVKKTDEVEQPMEVAEESTPPPESKLDARIQALLKLICNIQAMEEAVTQLEFDATRSPLGKLTPKQIAEGYRLLGEIEEFVKNKKFGGEFVQAVNEYYTKIPHSFGFRQPPLIKTVEMIQKETELLQVLEDIEIAVRNFGEAKKTEEKIATVDKYYNNMNCTINAVEKGSDDHKMVEKYMKMTHGDTHMYTMKITSIYQVDRHTETERFKKDIGNRMLLWHGSRVTNFYGILSQGLRIAPPEAPVCGYMFGKGIYFADMASKSGNYCFPAPGKPGLLLLCEVALGTSNELYQSDYHADKLPAGMSSTKGVGRTYPREQDYFALEDGTIVPCGKPVKRKDNGVCNLLYNEYIVYSVEQVRIRYLVEVEFDM